MATPASSAHEQRHEMIPRTPEQDLLRHLTSSVSRASRVSTPVKFSEPAVHPHRQQQTGSPTPHHLSSSSNFNSSQVLESHGSFHEEKSLQGAVLASRHNRTDDQVAKIVQWLTCLDGMQQATPAKVAAAMHMSSGVRLLLHQVVYKAGRPAEDIFFVIRGRILLREAREAVAVSTSVVQGSIGVSEGGAAVVLAAPVEASEPANSVEVHAGSWFGEAELLAGCKRMYTAEAAENGSIVLKLPAQAYRACMEPFRAQQFESKVQFLSQLPPLKGLALADVRHMAPCFQLVEFKQGEVLVRQGEKADSMYAIKDGTCCVVVDPKYRMDAPGTEGKVAEVDTKKTIQVCMLGATSIIGEAAVAIKTRKRTASVLAHTSVQAYRIHRIDLLRHMPTDQLELLRLIASEKVSMMDQSVSARQHMKDQILHGRHLREILLEQQKVQQQLKGMPASLAPGHEEYWQMMTVLKRYKRPTAPLDQGAPNMVLGLAPAIPNLSDEHSPAPKTSVSESNAAVNPLAWDEQLIMAELKLEPSTNVVVLDPATDAPRSSRRRQPSVEAAVTMPHEAPSSPKAGTKQPATATVAGTSAVSFSQSFGGFPRGDIVAADEAGSAPLWRPVAAPPVNTRATTTVAASLAVAAAMGPPPVMLHTVTGDAPEWGATSRNRASQSRSPLRQLLQADLANCWATHDERTPFVSRCVSRAVSRAVSRVFSRSVSRSVSAAVRRPIPRTETGVSVSVPIVHPASVPVMRQRRVTSRPGNVDVAAAFRIAQHDVSQSSVSSGRNSPTSSCASPRLMSLLKPSEAPPVPLSARPQWGCGRGSTDRPPPASQVLRGSTAALHKSAAAAAAAAAGPVPVVLPSTGRARSGPASRGATPQAGAVRLGERHDHPHQHAVDPSSLNLIEFTVVPVSHGSYSSSRQGTPSTTRLQAAMIEVLTSPPR